MKTKTEVVFTPEGLLDSVRKRLEVHDETFREMVDEFESRIARLKDTITQLVETGMRENEKTSRDLEARREQLEASAREDNYDLVAFQGVIELFAKSFDPQYRVDPVELRKRARNCVCAVRVLRETFRESWPSDDGKE